MSQALTVRRLVRNLGVYAVGVALAVTGALGLAEAISLWPPLAGSLLIVGLALVLVVHEFLDGPV